MLARREKPLGPDTNAKSALPARRRPTRLWLRGPRAQILKAVPSSRSALKPPKALQRGEITPLGQAGSAPILSWVSSCDKTISFQRDVLIESIRRGTSHGLEQNWLG